MTIVAAVVLFDLFLGDHDGLTTLLLLALVALVSPCEVHVLALVTLPVAQRELDPALFRLFFPSTSSSSFTVSVTTAASPLVIVPSVPSTVTASSASSPVVSISVTVVPPLAASSLAY